MADGHWYCTVGGVEMNKEIVEEVICGFLGLTMMSSIFMGDTQTVQLIATGLIGYIGRGIVKGGDDK